MSLKQRLVDWWKRSPFSNGVTEEKRQRWAREMEAWQDARIAEYELHQANEDMCFPGDPPWYDVCEEVGDGHSHYVPLAVLGPKASG